MSGCLVNLIRVLIDETLTNHDKKYSHGKNQNRKTLILKCNRINFILLSSLLPLSSNYKHENFSHILAFCGNLKHPLTMKYQSFYKGHYNPTDPEYKHKLTASMWPRKPCNWSKDYSILQSLKHESASTIETQINRNDQTLGHIGYHSHKAPGHQQPWNKIAEICR